MIRYVPVVLVLSVFALGASAQNVPSIALGQSTPPAQKAPSHPPPPPAVDQQQFISYWTTETGWRTELQLRNNQVGHILTVTPVLRAADGTETTLFPVVVQPQEVKTLDLATAIGTSAPQLIGAYGSLALRYRAQSQINLYAVAMIMGIGHSRAFHIDATGEDQTENVGSREGIWWLPNPTANDYLVVTNQGQNPLQANLSVFDAAGKPSTQIISLAPRAMVRYSIRQIVAAAGLAGSYGGIKVSAASHAGSLDTLHVVFDQNGGFSAVMKMFDYDPRAQLKERDYAGTGVWTLRAPMLALSNPDPALAFPVGTTLHPQLFIRNNTGRPTKLSLLFNWHSDSADGQVPATALQLAPYETQQIDVASLPGTKAIPADAHWASVTLTTDGLPDEVVAVAASYDSSLRYGAQTPFSDQLALQWEGGQWQYDPQHDSIITAGNGSAQPTQTAFTILYNQGTQKYELDQTLQPGQQMWMDIGKLIREGTPDKNGNVLPADLTSGSYDVRDLTNKTTATLFEGKVIYDKTYGHVTYGCAACCGYFIPILWYNPINIFYQGLEDDGVQAWYPCESEYNDVSSPFYYNWSSGDTSIATVNSYGTHTGVSVGSTTSQTNGNLMSNDAKNLCPALHRTPGGGANVNPQILLGGPSGTNITNNSSNPQSVVVGQQIILYAKYGGVSVNSQSWTVPGTTVGGFNTTAPNAGPTPTNFTQQSTTFYWVVPASSQTVTFTLNYGSQQIATAQAFFTVAGPTSAGTYSNPQLGQLQFINNGTTSADIEFGSQTGTPGIGFFGKATSPSQDSGTYEWDQVISNDSYSYTVGTTTTTCNGPVGLDNGIPTVEGFIYSDSPGRGLLPADNEFTWNWNSTVYLMWNPGLINSIRVPLGYVSWSFFADVVQNLSTNMWTVQPDSSQQTTLFTASSSYPQWNSVVKNGSLGGCP